MYDKMPDDTTTVVQHPPETHLGLPTTSWLRLSGFDKRSCPYVGRWSIPTNRCQFHHDLRSIMFTGREQGCSAAASSPMNLQANYTPRVTPPIAHETCRNPDHAWVVYFSTTVTRKTEASTSDMLCPHRASAMNRQLWLRQVLSALGAEIPGKEKK